MAAAMDLREHCDIVLTCYTFLANRADRVGGREGLLWNITPKHHWFWHWAQKAVYLNPRKTICVVDEHSVGDVKEMLVARTPGTPMEGVPSRVMEKIVWQMHFANIRV